MIDNSKIVFMTEWAGRYQCELTIRGEVGFGRPCVGIKYGQSYVDYDWELGAGGNAFWTPTDAYHKHDCLAVLVHRVVVDEEEQESDYDRALEQLFEWVNWLDTNGFGITTQARETYNKSGFGRELELLMGGLTQAKVVKL